MVSFFPYKTLSNTVLGTINKTLRGSIQGLIWLHL